MMKNHKRIGFLVALLLVAGLILVPSVMAAQELGCGESTSSYTGEIEFTIPSGGLDCSATSDHGIIIDSGGVTLDCGGEEISGLVSSSSYIGIYLDYVDEVNVRNCVISDFRYGIGVIFSTENIIENNEVTDSNNRGIYFQNSDQNQFVFNNISGGDSFGIYFKTSIDNNISFNNVSGNSKNGILLSGSDSNVLGNNTVESNGEDGIQLSYSDNNQLIENQIIDSGSEGIYMSGASYNLIEGNNITNTFVMGVYLASNSNENNFSYNLFENTGNSAIWVDGSDSNIFLGDLMVSSGNKDIQLFSATNSKFNKVVACEGSEAYSIDCDGDSSVSGSENYFRGVLTCADAWPVKDTDYYLCSDDSDGDGCTNEEELTEGTNPQDVSDAPSSCATSSTSVDGDLTGNGVVDSEDLAAFKLLFAEHFRTGNDITGDASDLNDDGYLTFADVLLFIQYYVSATSAAE